MKRPFLAVFLALGVIMSASAGVNTLRVVPKSGDPVLFHVDGKPEITRDDKTITITTIGNAQSQMFQLEDILHLDFIENGQDKVEDVITSGNSLEIRQTDQALLIDGIPDNSIVQIFGIDGRQVMQTAAAGSLTVDSSGFPAGIYIVRINNFSFKVRF